MKNKRLIALAAAIAFGLMAFNGCAAHERVI